MATKSKTSAKKRSSTATSIQKREADNYRSKKNQRKKEIVTIVIFALSLLLLALVIIPGENVWKFLHDVIFGLFGALSFIVPIFLMVVAVMQALERYDGRMTAKFVEIGVLFLSIASLIDIFTSGENYGYLEHIVDTYNNGVEIKGAGVMGGIIGYPLKYALSTTGACIVLLLLLFIFVMLIADLNLGTVLRFFIKRFSKKRVEVAEDDKDESSLEEQDEKPEPFKFDIPVDDIPVDRPNDAPTEKGKHLVETYYDDSEKTSDTKEYNIENGDGESIPFSKVLEESKKQKKASKKTETLSDDLSQEDSFVPEYRFPPLTLLKSGAKTSNKNYNEMENTANRLVDVLRSFGVETRVLNVSQGPAVTRYELQPSAGVKVSKITNLSDDIALNLATAGVRIEAPIPNKAAVGIEVPNKQTSVVCVRDILESDEFISAKSNLTVALGKDIGGNAIVTDIAKMPHGLIAGSTGSGKSVCINSMIISLLYKASPNDLKFIFIDPKMVELSVYNGIPHLLVPVVTDPRKASATLSWAINEMERRYKIFADNNVRDLTGYNLLAQKVEDLDHIPQIVIIIDELADLMMTSPREVEDSICRLAQKARAAGMHLIIATQRPSVDVVTGLIKANIPSRIAFAVSSYIDSRTILDTNGAEKLLGRGDMLFSPVGSNKPTRIQGCFVSDAEIEKVIDYVKGEYEHEYDNDVMDEIEKQAEKALNKKNGKSDDEEDGDFDPMIDAAIDCVVDAGQASTSMLQRKLKLGYARAARIMDQMEVKGIIGPYEGAKPREVLITKSELLEKRAREE